MAHRWLLEELRLNSWEIHLVFYNGTTLETEAMINRAIADAATRKVLDSEALEALVDAAMLGPSARLSDNPLVRWVLDKEKP